MFVEFINYNDEIKLSNLDSNHILKINQFALMFILILKRKNKYEYPRNETE